MRAVAEPAPAPAPRLIHKAPCALLQLRRASFRRKRRGASGIETGGSPVRRRRFRIRTKSAARVEDCCSGVGLILPGAVARVVLVMRAAGIPFHSRAG